MVESDFFFEKDYFFCFVFNRGIAQWISASVLGTEGRAFESYCPEIFRDVSRME